jgi:hypothetical protein
MEQLQLLMFTTPINMSVKTQLDVRAEQEDIQTSYDANLFSDEEMEDSASQPQNQCNKLDTPQYNMFLDMVRRCLHQARLMSVSLSI